MKLPSLKFKFREGKCRQLHRIGGKWVHTEAVLQLTPQGLKPWNAGRLPNIPVLYTRTAGRSEIPERVILQALPLVAAGQEMPYPPALYNVTRRSVMTYGIRTRKGRG